MVAEIENIMLVGVKPLTQPSDVFYDLSRFYVQRESTRVTTYIEMLRYMLDFAPVDPKDNIVNRINSYEFLNSNAVGTASIYTLRSSLKHFNYGFSICLPEKTAFYLKLKYPEFIVVDLDDIIDIVDEL